MSITSASEKGLFEESMLTGNIEETGFLRPLDSVSGMEHIGWFNTTEPIFRLNEGVSAREVAVAIADCARNGEMESAGLRAFVVPSSYEAESISDVFDAAVVLVKIENWWDNCLPNGIVGDTHAVKDYIAEREAEMSDRVRSNLSSPTIEIDDHAVFGGGYGQYQFVGWE